jgi:signal peptidase I
LLEALQHLLAVSALQIAVAVVLFAVFAAALFFLGVDWRWSLGIGVVIGMLSTAFTRTLMARPADKVRGSAPPAPADGMREIVETIVFVVVLVLMLKSFVAEAFVIPTGSMAETLWGYQKVVTCPDCGINFPVNCSDEVEPTDPRSATKVESCVCPNCRKRIDIKPAPWLSFLFGEPPPRDGESFTNWNSGDRVLVAKFVYDLFNRNPNRLDVVVFKFPGEDSGSGRSSRKQVPTNYIKRLIGLPGEVIAIHRGKLYILPPDKNPYRDNPAREKVAPVDLWKKENTYSQGVENARAQDLFREGDKGGFQILRKPAEVVLAMMRLVFDNDHPPKSETKGGDVGAHRWQAQPGWTEHGPHGFRARNDDQVEHWLHYQHILRGSEGKPQLITDFMGYNSFSLPGGENWASDLILECEAEVEKAEGQLTLEASHGSDRFQVRFDLSSGFCTLYRLSERGEEKLSEPVDAGTKGKGTYRLRLANVDDRLLVWVDNRLPFGEQGVPYDSPRNLVPTVENDLERPAGIAARGASVAVRRLRLFRDTYYTTGVMRPSDADVSGFKPGNPDTFREWQNPPVATYYVQPGHFLCLGDNSPASSDGRSWGLVPQRLMLGRALLVYYPFYPLGKVNRVGRIR